jgi:acetyltransferase-like isoleucine patch superfamily enzyme
MRRPVFHLLVPGKRIEGDWFDKPVPENISTQENNHINSAHSFVNFHSELNVGLEAGSNNYFYQTSFAVEEQGFLKIGSNCNFSSASIVVSKSVSIGDNVVICGGVTIVDSNFHPIHPEERLKDVKALAPSGNRTNRPAIESKPISIKDGAWIGLNATIMSGVTVGENAIVEAGSVVTKSVLPNQMVAGNPAKPVS